ncbi:MAG: hypothetical protein ACLFMX_07315 [Halobacteriales archaeon]
MLERVSRTLVFGAYQLSIALGILLLPAAIVSQRLGVPLPIHRVIRALGAAYERFEADA